MSLEVVSRFLVIVLSFVYVILSVCSSSYAFLLVLFVVFLDPLLSFRIKQAPPSTRTSLEKDIGVQAKVVDKDDDPSDLPTQMYPNKQSPVGVPANNPAQKFWNSSCQATQLYVTGSYFVELFVIPC